MVNSTPKHKIPMSVYSPFTVVVSENVFCQGMVALLNPVVVFFLECFMFIRAKYVLQFSRCDDLQNTLLNPAIENRRIVWTCIFEAAGSKHFVQLAISHCYTLQILTPTNRCNFFSMLAVNFVG